MQWLVEEALMAKLDRHDQERDAAAYRDHEVEAAQQRVRQQLDEARRGGQ